MDTGMILSLVTLSVSLAIPILRLVDWLLRIDPRFVMSVGKRLLWLATLAAVPCLVLLVLYQQWTMAVVLAAALLFTPTGLNLRTSIFGTTFRPAWQEGDPPDPNYGPVTYGPDSQPPDTELVRRATIVLEDYLAYAGHPQIGVRGANNSLTRSGEPTAPVYASPMSTDEALDVLGLNRSATAAEIGFAHRQLMMLVHPDRGGTNYLATKINKAKDILLASLSESQGPRA